MEKNKLAVEWLWDAIRSHFEHDGDLLEAVRFAFDIAKQKQKEQMIEFAVDHYTNPYLNFEKYYNEKYRNE